LGFPPRLLHLARNDFRALPCSPLALAWSEHAFEIACLLLDLPNSANAELDDATSATIVSDRTAAQTAIKRIIAGLHNRTIEPRWGGHARLGPTLWPSQIKSMCNRMFPSIPAPFAHRWRAARSRPSRSGKASSNLRVPFISSPRTPARPSRPSFGSQVSFSDLAWIIAMPTRERFPTSNVESIGWWSAKMCASA
jgi:hypothetical protein